MTAAIQWGAVYAAGDVQRWHANPAMAREGQTNADHQGRCVQLLLLLHPGPSVALIKAAAFHDLGERWVGDMPRPLKAAHPDLAQAHAAVEAEAIAQVKGALPDLTDDECRWLKLVDQLEATCFVILRRPEEYRRKASGWQEEDFGLFARARRLGVHVQVRQLLHDLKAGAW
jgi:5'-deoxynucleotidase